MNKQYFPRFFLKAASDPFEQQRIRDSLADDIAQYLKGGGEIENIPFGRGAYQWRAELEKNSRPTRRRYKVTHGD